MIKQLQQHWIQDGCGYGNIYEASAPSNIELMNKINEIIEIINKMNNENAETQPEDS